MEILHSELDYFMETSRAHHQRQPLDTFFVKPQLCNYLRFQCTVELKRAWKWWDNLWQLYLRSITNITRDYLSLKLPAIFKPTTLDLRKSIGRLLGLRLPRLPPSDQFTTLKWAMVARGREGLDPPRSQAQASGHLAERLFQAISRVSKRPANRT